MVRDRAELADEVFVLDIADEAVRVGVTETQSVAERQNQAIVVELIHQELRKFEYGTSDSFRDAAYELGQIGNQTDVGALAHIFHRLAVKRVGDQFVQRRLEVGLRIFPSVVAEFEEWQH